MAIVSKDMDNVTEKQVRKLIDLTWKAYSAYEEYTGDSFEEKGTKLYREYQRRKEQVEGYKVSYPWLIPNFP